MAGKQGSGFRVQGSGFTACCLLLAALFCLGGSARGEEPLAERRGRIESMTAAEQEQLLRRKERFDSLSAAERERLLKLHHDLESDPDAAALREVMRRYYEWLKTLPPYRRAELAVLEPKERLQRIQQWRNEPKDMDAVRRWLADYASKNEARFLARPEVAKMPPLWRRFAVIRLLWEQMSDADLADLRSKLAPETRQRLEKLPAAEQWRTVGSWLRPDLRGRGGPRRAPGAPPPGAPPPVEEELLADFFERELTDEERDGLLRMTGEEMQKKLWGMYLSRHQPTEPGMGPGHGRWPPRSGPDWGHPKKPDKGPPRPDKGPEPLPPKPKPPPGAELPPVTPPPAEKTDAPQPGPEKTGPEKFGPQKTDKDVR